ncbi:MAG: trigger factor [Candidatus Pacebacteria bacterium]|nr:trigger factor [Candidatus Paceibacterota bacterium]
MDIKQNKLTDYSLEIIFSFNEDDINKNIDKASKQISKEIKVDGFREGKAPTNIIEQKVGKEMIFEEAAKITFQESYVDYILKNDIEIVSSPEVSIQKLVPNKEAEFKAIVSIVPELTLPDYKTIGKKTAKEKQEVSVTDAEVKETIDNLVNSKSKFVESKEIEEENIVECNYSVLVNDKEILNKTDQRFVFGKHVPFEEMNKELKGAKPGEEKEINITLQDSPEVEKEYVGKPAILKIKINKILKKEVPELTDDFVKENFQIDSIKDLENRIKENLLKEKQAKEEQRIRILALTNIRKEIKEDIPQELIQREVKSMVQDFEHRISQIGMKMEDYLKQINKKVEEIEKEFEPMASDKIFDSLILRQIKKIENIDVTDDEVDAKAKELFEMVKSQNPDIKDMESINKQALYSYAKEMLLNTKIFDFILNN